MAQEVVKAPEFDRSRFSERYICIGIDDKNTVYELDFFLDNSQDLAAVWQGAGQYYFKGNGFAISPNQFVFHFISQDPREPIAGMQYYNKVDDHSLVGHWHAWITEGVDGPIERINGHETCLKVSS